MSQFNHNQQTILFLAANPEGTHPLQLEQELTDISAGLQRSRKSDHFKLELRSAVKPRDIQRSMLDVKPQIVHFSGHGTGKEGLVFEDEEGQIKLISGPALAGLFKLFANKVTCVVLNACYSQVQAEAIAEHIDYVIGMNAAIGDQSAIEFSVGFYDALGAGESIEFAYQLGCSAVQLAGELGHLVPVLLKKSSLHSPVKQEPAEAEPALALSRSHTKPQPVEIFISYSHRDDDLREELVVHLSNLRRQKKIHAWHDRAIEAGEEWDAQIRNQLEVSQIILLLITPRFMASDFCYDEEMMRAMERHEAGTARVIPIILKPTDWKDSPFSKLQVLPRDAKPITEWGNQDAAFLNVTEGIRRAVESLQQK